MARAVKLLRLLWWGFCHVTGLQMWRYRRGFFLPEFNRAWIKFGGEPFASCSSFEAHRQRVARAFLQFKHRMPMPTTDETAAALWSWDIAKCHLFSFVARREQHPLRFLRWIKWLPRQGRVLEYGAGAAPLAWGLERAWPFCRPQIEVADINWPLLDYCKVLFAKSRDTHILTLTGFKIGGWCDGIVCTETLEHVPDPLATAQMLVAALRHGGRLLYDYAEQTEDQPLAPRGLSARAETLAWLAAHTRRVVGPTAQGLYVVEKA